MVIKNVCQLSHQIDSASSLHVATIYWVKRKKNANIGDITKNLVVKASSTRRYQILHLLWTKGTGCWNLGQVKDRLFGVYIVFLRRRSLTSGFINKLMQISLTLDWIYRQLMKQSHFPVQEHHWYNKLMEMLGNTYVQLNITTAQMSWLPKKDSNS